MQILLIKLCQPPVVMNFYHETWRLIFQLLYLPESISSELFRLTKRPAKSSNWCCQLCKDVPSLIRQLNETINILSDWQRSMRDQQQDLKAENKALKEQIKEIIHNQRRPDAVKKRQPVSNITESDRQSY